MTSIVSESSKTKIDKIEINSGKKIYFSFFGKSQNNYLDVFGCGLANSAADIATAAAEPIAVNGAAGKVSEL